MSMFSGACSTRSRFSSGILVQYVALLPGALYEIRDLRGVLDAVVLVTVVHEDVQLLRLAGQLTRRRHPLLELVLRVEVAEALRRRDPPLLPVVGVVAMEADHRELGGSRGGDRRHRRLEPLRL